MVLDELRDGASRHSLVPDQDARRLIFILCLPLVDGVFATLLVTGALQTFSDVVAVSLTIFTGAGALAVLYSYSESREEAVGMVKQAAPYMILGAMAVSAVAPIYEQIFYVERLRYAAGLALVSIALKISGFEYSDKLSVPAILVTGMVLSFRNPAAINFSLEYAAPALMTAIVTLVALYLAARLNVSGLNLRYIRRGASLVLLMIALSLYGIEIPSKLGIAVLGASIAVSYRY